MIEAAGREVRLSNPGKVYFPRPGWTKLDLVGYYLETAEAVTIHLRERPTVMKRFVSIEGGCDTFAQRTRLPSRRCLSSRCGATTVSAQRV